MYVIQFSIYINIINVSRPPQPLDIINVRPIGRVESEDPDDDIIAAKIVGVHDANTDGISADHSVPCAQDGDVFSISRPTRRVQ